MIQIAEYLPYDVTKKAHSISAEVTENREKEGRGGFGLIRKRIPLMETFQSFNKETRQRISAGKVHEIIFGRSTIDMWDVEQLVDISGKYLRIRHEASIDTARSASLCS